jgi:alpha/beta superfamily hydrolase
MKFPANTETFLWGAAAGAVALAIVGFSLGGWVTAGTAQERMRTSAQEAVVASLTPICVAQFRKDPQAKASLATLKQTDHWKQAGYVSEAGWAKMPGSTTEPDIDVAQACANVLLELPM